MSSSRASTGSLPGDDPPVHNVGSTAGRAEQWKKGVAALWRVNHVVVGLRGASPRLSALPAAVGELEELAREADCAPEVARAVEARARELGRHLAAAAAALDEGATRLAVLADDLRRRDGSEG